ncbi:MAG: agmatine deiminase [Deltaproteobacteria bacterium HGW-Deltaproteobacteria-4]|nr:MAG: agmatine deiminase [Deltaproteobacteria bacterium HGW-Deltaproteobacteria-4]
MMTNRRLPAEWEEQDGVLLSWPHADSDWSDDLDKVEPVFAAIAAAISHYERVVIVAPESELILPSIVAAGGNPQQVTLFNLPTNDTWSRDFGPITVVEEDRLRLLDFGFNGWGLKFAANHDNQITRRLVEAGLFGKNHPQVVGLILEGGAIESDGAGTILTTSECLLNPNRNPHLQQREIEAQLGQLLGAQRFLWLEHGYLVGDDTDSHIDTLARLCPNDTIAYVFCDDPGDEHYAALQRMREQLRSFRTADDRPYRLLPLPWPQACYGPSNERLPATYANFLIINGAVLVPTYNCAQDETALNVIAQAFPDRKIIGIDCSPLILQHGSLHCVTMQLPQGVLTGDK